MKCFWTLGLVYLFTLQVQLKAWNGATNQTRQSSNDILHVSSKWFPNCSVSIFGLVYITSFTYIAFNAIYLSYCVE